MLNVRSKSKSCCESTERSESNVDSDLTKRSESTQRCMPEVRRLTAAYIGFYVWGG